MDILGFIVTQVKMFIEKIRCIYSFVFSNFFTGLEESREPRGFDFF